MTCSISEVGFNEELGSKQDFPNLKDVILLPNLALQEEVPCDPALYCFFCFGSGGITSRTSGLVSAWAMGVFACFLLTEVVGL